MPDMPAAEVDVDVSLVRALLAEQHPELAGLDLHLVASGWDNVIFRLGADLAVRLPRRAVAAPLIVHEQLWLPVLAAKLSLAIPVPLHVGRPGAGYPLHVGRPGAGYPWSWSITPWFDGEVAVTSPPVDGTETARILGRFLSELHQPAPADAPKNPYRGLPLTDREVLTTDHLGAAREVLPDLDWDELQARWSAAVSGPRWSGPPVWLHGDLHPANLVVRDGAIVGVIDFGDLTAGDPATDLSVAWMLLDPSARSILRREIGVDGDTWARARAWALAHGAACVANSANNPLIAVMGRRTLEAVDADRT